MFSLIVLFTTILVLASGITLGPNHKIQSRMLNGDTFDIADVKYQVALQYDLNGEAMFYLRCGGILIGISTVLTSASCTIGSPTGRMRMRVGSNLNDEGGSTYFVRKVTNHPNWNSTTSDYDAALINSESTIVVGGNVARAVLPAPESEITVGTNGFASGWGAIRESAGGSRSTYLQKTDLTVVDQDKCANIYEDYEDDDRKISPRMFCAGGLGFGTCEGDEGGPFVIDGVVVGISSWRRRCGIEGLPDIFTRVSTVVNWINDHNTYYNS